MEAKWNLDNQWPMERDDREKDEEIARTHTHKRKRKMSDSKWRENDAKWIFMIHLNRFNEHENQSIKCTTLPSCYEFDIAIKLLKMSFSYNQQKTSSSSSSDTDELCVWERRIEKKDKKHTQVKRIKWNGKSFLFPFILVNWEWSITEQRQNSRYLLILLWSA